MEKIQTGNHIRWTKREYSTVTSTFVIDGDTSHPAKMLTNPKVACQPIKDLYAIVRNTEGEDIYRSSIINVRANLTPFDDRYKFHFSSADIDKYVNSPLSGEKTHISISDRQYSASISISTTPRGKTLTINAAIPDEIPRDSLTEAGDMLRKAGIYCMDNQGVIDHILTHHDFEAMLQANFPKPPVSSQEVIR